MKGIVFSEFIELVEEYFSPEIADQMIESAKLPSGGAYTSVGTYDHHEMVALLVQLSALTSTSIPDLLRVFGRHLFGRFATLYPMFFEGIDSSFDFLSRLDDYIHVEVRKLYPDADLPKFLYQRLDEDTLRMEYQSTRALGDLAEGLIQGCIQHYGERIEVTRDDHDGGQQVFFTLRKTAG